MRLICPRCGAQYEIDAAAIPAAGRDVECSACDHVWRAWPVSQPAEPFDPTARPRLSRPLSESVIEILRQEAARELEVRAAERRAQRLADAGEIEAGVIEAGKAESPFPDAAAALAAGAVAPSPDDTLLPGDAPEVQSGGTDDVRAPAAAAPSAKQSAKSSAAASVAAPSDAKPQPTTTTVATLAAMQSAPPVAVTSGVPTVLTPATKQSAPFAPVAPAAQPPVALAARPQPASAWAAAPPAPAQAVSRRRYDAGFHLAVMLALVALALYALAPRLGDQQPFGPVLLEWRGKVDQGRDWLSAQGDTAIAGLRAVIDGQGAAD